MSFFYLTKVILENYYVLTESPWANGNASSWLTIFSFFMMVQATKEDTVVGVQKEKKREQEGTG